MQRLPHFLDHYRRLGVAHFLIVDNDSTDGTVDFLSNQQDVSIWNAAASYKSARYGMDWLNWLLLRYGREHWCLTVDADETFVYPDYDTSTLPELTRWLETRGVGVMGALTLDLYPKGGLETQSYALGQPPWAVLDWFDAHGYWSSRHRKTGHLKVQGGIRARKLFDKMPDRAPTLNKLPLVRWRRGYVYMNSTHNMLPPELEALSPGTAPSGVLLHSKFLPGAAARAAEERRRRQHFSNARTYAAYYQTLAAGPDFWDETATRFTDAAQLEALGLMFRGGWNASSDG